MNRPLVVLQRRYPVADVRRLIPFDSAREAEPAQDEGGAEFGDDFLEGVGRVAEADAEFAAHPAVVAGPVDGLMRERGVVADRIVEAEDDRHLDDILGGIVGRAVPSRHDLRADRPEKGFGAVDPVPRTGSGTPLIDPEPGWQPIELFAVEHLVGCHERDGWTVPGPLPAIRDREREGPQYPRTLLAVEDLCTATASLGPGQPERIRVAPRVRRERQHEAVSPRKGEPGVPGWHQRAPWPPPRNHALPESCQDPSREVLEEARRPQLGAHGPCPPLTVEAHPAPSSFATLNPHSTQVSECLS